MGWIYRGEEILDEQVQGYVGFTYIITNLVTRRSYIGKKLIIGLRRRKIKGRYRRVEVQSDWRRYFSSCKALHDDVAVIGEEKFSREILRLCRTKSELNYFELKTQIDSDVILRPDDFYNSYIGSRINRKHLQNVIDASREVI